MRAWQRIIIAIDDSPRSTAAVDYVGTIAGNFTDVFLCLLHVYPEPPPDYYRTGATLDAYRRQQEAAAGPVIARSTDILISHGVHPDAITAKCLMAENASISAAILDLQTREGYGTIAVGKRGISKKEEFLFGSISNALIHNGRDIAVWVIG